MAIADDRRRAKAIIENILEIRLQNGGDGVRAIDDFLLTLGFRTLLELYENVKAFDESLAVDLLDAHPTYSSEETNRIIARKLKVVAETPSGPPRAKKVDKPTKTTTVAKKPASGLTEPLMDIEDDILLKYTEEKYGNTTKTRRLPGNRRMVDNRRLVDSMHVDTSKPARLMWNILKDYSTVEPWFMCGLLTHPDKPLNTFADLLVVELDRTTPQRMNVVINLIFKLLVGHWSDLDRDTRNKLLNFVLTEGSNKDIILINLYFGTAVKDTALIEKSARVFFNYTASVETLATMFHRHTKLQKRFMRDIELISTSQVVCYEEESYDF